MAENEIVKEGKKTAILAYFTFVGTLIAWSINSDTTEGRKKNPFASFHIRQCIGLNVVFIVLGVLISGVNGSLIDAEMGGSIMMVTIPFWVFFIVLWGFGFMGALNGQLAIIPLLGKYFQKWFKGIA